MMRSKSKVQKRSSRIPKILVFCVWATTVNFSYAQYQDPQIVEAEGVVRGLSYARNIAVIGGLSYYFAADAVVEIRGTYGAFTMLEKGMKVAFSFHRISDSRREIVKLVQLSENRRMDEN